VTVEGQGYGINMRGQLSRNRLEIHAQLWLINVTINVNVIQIIFGCKYIILKSVN